MSGVEYHEPSTVEEACALLGRYGSAGALLAGGTALTLQLQQGLVRPGALIHLGRIAELGGIAADAERITIGALASLAEAARAPEILAHQPALAETFRKIASPRIRNAGTVGGNLARVGLHYDPPVTLLALDAAVTLRSTAGARVVGLRELLAEPAAAPRPDELLTRVELPTRRPATGLAFEKFWALSQYDYATAAAAVRLSLAPDGRIAEARVALGSVAPLPFRALAAERLLVGERPDGALLAEAGALAAAAADPPDDLRGGAAYKRELVKVLVRRAAERAEAAARAGG